MHSMPNFAVLKGNQDTSRAPNNNKQPCSCPTSLRNLLFHPVQRIGLLFKSTDLYLFCTTKVFPKFPLPFQSQASFQRGQFGSYDYAARSLSLVAFSLTSQRSRMLMQKRALFAGGRMPKIFLGITGMHEYLGRDYGIETRDSGF